MKLIALRVVIALAICFCGVKISYSQSISPFNGIALSNILSIDYSPAWIVGDSMSKKGSMWITGSPSGSCSTSPCAYAGILTNSNSLSSISGGIVSSLFVQNNAGGGKGGYTGIDTVLNLNVKTTNTGNTGYYVGIQSTAQATVNDNGTALVPSGHLYGSSAYARLVSNATYWDQVIGSELNVQVNDNASVSDFIGQQIVILNTPSGGSRANIGMTIAADATSSPIDCGYCFGAYQGYNAMRPTGTLIGTWKNGGSINELIGTVANGVYLNGYTITGKAYSSAGYSVDGSGNLSTKSVSIAGAKFTTSGCSVSASTGGSTAGVFTLGATSCNVVVTMADAVAANGWTCSAHNRNTPTSAIAGEVSSTTTTATFAIPPSSAINDVISFSCVGY